MGAERARRSGAVAGKVYEVDNGGTPGYMVREEWQRGKLREREGSRAWGFEKK